MKSLFTTRYRAMQTMVITTVIAFVTSGCWNGGNDKDQTNLDHSSMENSQKSKLESNASPVKRTTHAASVDGTSLTITAQQSNLEVSNGVVLPVWTFNNSVPGPQIRVKVGVPSRLRLKMNCQSRCRSIGTAIPYRIAWMAFLASPKMLSLQGSHSPMSSKQQFQERIGTIPIKTVSTKWIKVYTDLSLSRIQRNNIIATIRSSSTNG